MSDRIDEDREKRRTTYEEGRARSGTEGEGERDARGIRERLKEGAKETAVPVRGEAGGLRRDPTERAESPHGEEPGAMKEEGGARLIRDYRVTPEYAGKTFVEGDRRITPQGIRSDVERGAEGAGERIKEGVEGTGARLRREVGETRHDETAERGERNRGEGAGAESGAGAGAEARESVPEDTDLERRMERATAIPPIGDLDSIKRARMARSESEREGEGGGEGGPSRDYETGGTSGFGSEGTGRHAGTTGAFGMTTEGGTSGTDRMSDNSGPKRVKEKDTERDRDERA